MSHLKEIVPVAKVDTSLIKPIVKDPAKDILAQSLFQDHLLPFKNMETHLHFTNYDYGVAAVLFFLYVLFVWLYVSNRKRLNQIIKAFYVNRYANQLAREEFALGNRVSFFLGVLFIISSTLFICQVNQYYGFVTGIDSAILFLIIAAILLLSYSIKLVVIQLLGFVFKMPKEVNEYRMSIFLFANTLGLLMFPIVICLAFLKQASPLVFIYAGFSIVIAFLFIRLVRGVVIGLNSIKVSKFYLFLYLCTLEILPFVIAVKLFILKIN